tara:strand:- start:127 stop:1164 length:1038 start_codon:yes stop_codon:yes gene_type:complete
MDIKQTIKYQILKSKKDMRLDIFLNKVLFNENGYYYDQKPIGRKKDFLTSPEVSQLFGEIIGLYLLYFWKTHINSKFNLIELGPGNGTLFKDIVNSVKNYPDFLNNANITFIEINKYLTKKQKESFKNLNLSNTNWKSKFNLKSNYPSIIYSNEFFDCFPVRQFFLNEIWYEKFVSFNKIENYFFFKDKIVSEKKMLSLLDLYKKEKLLEISFERNRYYKDICNHIRDKGGLFLTVDYGYFKNINSFSLQAIRNHKFSNVLEFLGKQDISSHVNFLDLKSIAEKNKLNIEEMCTQRDFLIKYGILERQENLLKLNNKIKLDGELDRLINTNNMGDLFKFLVVSNL